MPGQRRRSAESRTASPRRSEEHTSELQSLMRISYAVFCLKKKKKSAHQPVKEYSYIENEKRTSTQQKKKIVTQENIRIKKKYSMTTNVRKDEQVKNRIITTTSSHNNDINEHMNNSS